MWYYNFPLILMINMLLSSTYHSLRRIKHTREHCLIEDRFNHNTYSHTGIDKISAETEYNISLELPV